MDGLGNVIKKNGNIPNGLSALRIVLIAPFVYFFINDDYISAMIVLLFSGVSDMLDGLLARKLHQETRLGKLLDPVADKLTLAAVVACMAGKFPEMIALAVILIVKDALMIIAGWILLKRGQEPPPAKWYGKLGTVTFYMSVIMIVGFRYIYGFSNLFLSISLLLLTSVVMVFALIKYAAIFFELLRCGKL